MGIVKKVIPIFPSLLLPLVLLSAALLGQNHLYIQTEQFQNITPYLPIIILSASALLSLHYHNSNTFLVVLILGISYIFWNNLFHLSSIENQTLIQTGITLLLPINIALFTLIHDRGILSFSGMLKSLFLAAQFVILISLDKQQSQIATLWINTPLIHIDLNIGSINQNVLAVWVISIIALIGASVRNHLARAITGAFLAVGIYLLGSPQNTNAWVFFTVAGIVILLSQIQYS